MGPVPPPPSPPALVMTLLEAARVAGGSTGAPVTLGDVADAFVGAVQMRKDADAQRNYRRKPYWIGPKVRGKRDASLKARANRRKT